MSSKYCIAFAGAAGSSKTPIANYLSAKLNLPIFNNDSIRKEVIEDVEHLDVDIYDARQKERLDAVFEAGISFIYDASVDRKWSELRDQFDGYGYKSYVISLDLSYEFLLKSYKAKDYTDVDHLPKYIEQHAEFLNKYGKDVNLHITDAEFMDRLRLSHEHVATWIKGLQ